MSIEIMTCFIHLEKVIKKVLEEDSSFLQDCVLKTYKKEVRKVISQNISIKLKKKQITEDIRDLTLNIVLNL